MDTARIWADFGMKNFHPGFSDSVTACNFRGLMDEKWSLNMLCNLFFFCFDTPKEEVSWKSERSSFYKYCSFKLVSTPKHAAQHQGRTGPHQKQPVRRRVELSLTDCISAPGWLRIFWLIRLATDCQRRWEILGGTDTPFSATFTIYAGWKQ